MSYNAESSNTQYKNLEDFLPQPPSATVDIPSTTDYPITEGIAISNKEGFIFKVLDSGFIDFRFLDFRFYISEF